MDGGQPETGEPEDHVSAHSKEPSAPSNCDLVSEADRMV